MSASGAATEAPVCPSCGAENTAGARFCSSCGASLTAPMPSREERKVVTVLFADLVGFTQRSERLDPEDVRAMLGPYYARVRSDLERYGGTVEKFIGDAVMAIFGAPVAHEDDPERAVRAAITIREAIKELNEADPGLELQLRIAVNTGEALVALGARIGEGEGMVAGDIVNTAARLQMAAPVNGILVGEQTYRATQQVFEYREAVPVQAKGKAEPIQVWEALEARASLGVDVVPRRATALVGRREELDLLRDALARARRERSPQLVTLVGVPGIGKSRLVWELFDAVEADPDLIYWRQGRSLPYGEGVSFWALGEMAKAQAGVLESDSAEEAEAKLVGAVAEAIPDGADAHWVAGHLRPLIGLGAQQELTGDRRSEAFAAWRRFFEALAEDRPLVLVFDDLHWADEGLLDFVDYLLDWATGVPLLAVCSARPELLEKRPGWGGGKLNATTVSLSPLTEEDTARFVSALLEQAVLPAETQAALLARAGGNPLYAEEYIRMLHDRGFLRREGAGWYLEREDELPLPESVQGIIAARLDALSSEEKELLQDAAVAGKVSWVGALAAIGDVPRWQVEERLHALERKEFLSRERRSTLAGETQYVFRHVLVRDVAYNQIPRAERVEKHRAAAEWLESLPADRSEDRAEMLAHHYTSALELARATGRDTAELAEPARRAMREAGDRALALSAFPSAVRFYRAALELWPEDDPERAQLLFRYGHARYGAEEAGDQELEEARVALLAQGDVESAVQADVLLADLTWRHGQRDRAFQYLERARELVRDLPTSYSKALVLSHVSRFHMVNQENEEAVSTGREALVMAEQLGLDELQSHALNNIGSARARGGDEGGLADLERSIEIGREVNSPETSRAYINLGVNIAIAGDLDRSWELIREGEAISQRLGHAVGLRWIRGMRPMYHYESGSWEEALAGAEEIIAESQAGSTHYLEHLSRSARANIRIARGDVAGALEDVREGLKSARTAGDRQALLPALGAFVKIALEAELRDEAATAADALLEHATAAPLNVWYAADAVPALVSLDRGEALREALRGATASRWREAAEAIVAGDFQRAGELFAQIGSRAKEADSRLRAAQSLIEAGLRPHGEAELERALAFYREVGAGAYVREGEALLAASA
jgi:class 3 adenylate cyclase